MQAGMRLTFLHILFLVYGSNAETPLVATCRGPQLIQVKQQTSSVHRSVADQALARPGNNTNSSRFNASSSANKTRPLKSKKSAPATTTPAIPVAPVIPILPASPPVPAVVVEPWQSYPITPAWAPGQPAMVPVVPGQVIPAAPGVAPPVVVPVPPCDTGSASYNTYNNVTVNIAGDANINVNGKGAVKDSESVPIPAPAPAPAPEPEPEPAKPKHKPATKVTTTTKAAPVTTTTKAAPVPSFVTKLFEPGTLGIMADWTIEPVVVDGVEEGSQAETKGVEKGWIVSSVGGKPYKESLLDEAIAGNTTYNMTFQTNPNAAPAPAANMT